MLELYFITKASCADGRPSVCACLHHHHAVPSSAEIEYVIMLSPQRAPGANMARSTSRKRLSTHARS
ncbi:hypothetical protein LZ30DRAFT_720534, partial [Colletotrichum cereale]